jgi:senataxin
MSSMERSAVSAGPRASAGMERDRMRIAILDEASIVCSTLSFSGAGVFMRMNRGFDVVVIDEAAQAVEPSTLVPLAHGCRQVFLVGDPLQLPATVLSTEAVAYGYGKSLFRRFQKAGYPVNLLNTQYRMHPEVFAHTLPNMHPSHPMSLFLEFTMVHSSLVLQCRHAIISCLMHNPM